MSESRQVYIVGYIGLQNDLLMKHVTSQTGFLCRLIENFNLLPQKSNTNKQIEYLALYDCRGLCRDDLNDVLTEIDTEVYINGIVAFFNLSPGLEIEKNALEFGVRGFFYEADTAASLIKGVEVLFSGDYWVSRQKIIECLALGSSKPARVKKDSVAIKILTAREIEILSMIAMGSGNDLIAETLFISPNTVRTHVYNIFKKINVPSRLQASLWAAKNI